MRMQYGLTCPHCKGDVFIHYFKNENGQTEISVTNRPINHPKVEMIK